MASAAETAGPPPPNGTFETHPLPSLLLELYRARVTGELTLTRDRVEKRIGFHDGAAVSSHSNVASESLATRLVDQGALSAADQARVAAQVERSGGQEGAALLSLGLVAPKALFLALKAQLRQRVLDCFGWTHGHFAFEGADAASDAVDAFRVDPIRLVHEGLMAHWSPDRLLGSMTTDLDRYPHPQPRMTATAARLVGDEGVERMLGALDGRRPLGEVIGLIANAPSALAALWVLQHARSFVCRETPMRNAAEAIAAQLDRDFEIDVEIQAPPSETSPRSEPVQVPARNRPNVRVDGSDDQSQAMRLEITERSARLDDLDFYEVLGLEPDAKPAQIKKAYFAAAKQYHPDTLARLSLEDLKLEAGRVFGRIAEAYETLSNAEKRRAYDANGSDGEPEFDAQRLAQAETFFRKGEILVRMGDFRGALEYLAPAVELWPDEAAYRSALGWALYKQPTPDAGAAREQLEAAHATAPDDPEVALRLGMVLRAAGEGPEDASRADTLLAKAKAAGQS